MNLLLENQVISEKEYGTNFAYIIKNRQTFLSTEYKVLQSQGDDGFVKCMKTLYNGDVQLFYIISPKKKFSDVIASLDESKFLEIVANLLKVVIKVKSNGFLKCENIDISFDKIFVDTVTNEVGIVYLPLSENVFNSYSTFESELRSSFVKLINSVSNIQGTKTTAFAVELSDATLSIDDLYYSIKGKNVNTSDLDKQRSDRASASSTSSASTSSSAQTGRLILVALNAPTRVELVVDKKEYIIGKNASQVNGVVSFNKAISRVHCKINCVGKDFTIMDLGSANGTFVNNKRLSPNMPAPLLSGDIVRLANSDFQVVLK